MIVDIQMTLDAEYDCDNQTDIYQAAEDVQQLLESTYNMQTQLNTEISAIYGEGYTVKGKSKTF
jgi:hypothetical protein